MSDTPNDQLHHDLEVLSCRYQVQKVDMTKRIAALQRQLSASQSSAMQAQFAHEEFKVRRRGPARLQMLHIAVCVAGQHHMCLRLQTLEF